MIMGLLGGIRMPSVPPVAETAAASSLRYPAPIMPGIMILPMAAVVAGPEPLSAAKIMQARMVTMARPPRMLPTAFLATSMISPVIPAGSMRNPAITKPMVAMSGNWSMPVYRFWGMNSIGNGIPIIEMMDASPITPNRGKPSNMKKTNDKTSSMA